LIYKEPLENSINYDDYVIVCARYSKNVDFLNEINIRNVILEKNHELPNKANEATSYLYYIIQNYDNLPENIIFIHDENESWHHSGKITEEIDSWINEYEKQGKTYYEFNSIVFNTGTTFIPDDVYDSNIAFKHFWDTVMQDSYGDYNTIKTTPGKCCAQFIISKNNILKNPKSFYENYYNWLVDKTNGEGNGKSDDIYSGWSTSRYAEWTWRFIFL